VKRPMDFVMPVFAVAAAIAILVGFINLVNS
jgi:hypothetical protein